MAKTADVRPPRDRILTTARDMFHRSGIRGVGVEAIADAAGTNKMTLYRHFRSKDELITACVREVVAEGDDMWRELAEEHPGDPLGQIHGWVTYAEECVCSDGRGCELANAAVELTEADHPARRVIEEFKIKWRNKLAELCGAAGIAKADLLADTLTLLLEGARADRLSAGTSGPNARFVQTAEAVITYFATERSTRPAAKKSRRTWEHRSAGVLARTE
jgi:AcrR family transcriptional regulator